MVVDLKINDKKVCFWNWNREAFNVMMRHNEQHNELLKRSETLRELIMQLKSIEDLNEVKADDEG